MRRFFLGGLLLHLGISPLVYASARNNEIAGIVGDAFERATTAYSDPIHAADLTLLRMEPMAGTMYSLRWVESSFGRRAEIIFPTASSETGEIYDREVWVITGSDTWEVNFFDKVAYKNLLPVQVREFHLMQGHTLYLDRFLRPDQLWNALFDATVDDAFEWQNGVAFEFQGKPGLRGRTVGFVEYTEHGAEIRQLVFVVPVSNSAFMGSSIHFGAWKEYSRLLRPSSMTYETGPLPTTLANGEIDQLLQWVGEDLKYFEVQELAFNGTPDESLFVFDPPENFTVFGPDGQGGTELIRNRATLQLENQREARREEAAINRQKKIDARLAGAKVSKNWGAGIMWTGAVILALSCSWVLLRKVSLG